MLCLQSRLCKCKTNFMNVVKWSSSASVFTNYPELIFRPKFSEAEQEKILNILNGTNSAQLLSLNVAQSRVKSFENYKKRKGPFKSLDELLEVDGVSVKMLEKLCKQLIMESPVQNGKSVNNENKRIKQFLTPPLPTNATDALRSAVGIHLAPMGVSWAKIVNINNTLESWGYQDFENLPKKLCPVETFQLAMDLLNQIPTGDVYVFEGTNGMGLQGQKPSTAVTAYTLHLELSSMLLALINTSKSHNKGYHDAEHQALTNCVYFLRSKLPARLFRTLVGNECVSNTATVSQLIGDSNSPDRTLPCSAIVVNPELKSDYLGQSSVHRELLGQALMLTFAFTDVCINRNPVSIKKLMPGKK